MSTQLICKHLAKLTRSTGESGYTNMTGHIVITNMAVINCCLDCPEPVCRYDRQGYDYARNKGVPPTAKV